jgi:hypothetical protein
MNRELLLCARDIENMYFEGIPLHKAIRHMQYLLAPHEVQAAKRELIAQATDKRRAYNEYKANMFDRYYHKQKQKGV